MQRIEDYVSKKVIMFWLDGYHELAHGERPEDAPVVNGGQKAADGVSATKLNKIMLDQAIDSLPLIERACVKARWTHKISRRDRLRMCKQLGISEAMYWTRSRQAVTLIYERVNGKAAGYKALFEKIIDG